MTSTAVVPRAPALNMGTLSDPAELGRMLAASGYFSDAQDAAQAVVKVLAGAELGFGPIASMTGVYIVKGRVTLSANLMAAAIKRHPLYDYRIGEHTDKRAVIAYLDARFPCSKCDGKGYVGGESRERCPACFGGRLECIGQSEFTTEHAKQANLTGGENWRKYPANMLLWRAMSNGAKFFCPDAFSGAPIYTPDELGAEVDPETGDFVQAESVNFTPRVLDVSGPAEDTTSPPPEPPAATADATAQDAPAEAPDDRPASEPENATEAAPASEPPADNGNVSEDEHKALAELLEAVSAPESFTRMALMSYGVESLADLTKTQAREVMGRAVARFGSKPEGAA